MDVPVFAEYQEVRANCVDARIVNRLSKTVITLEMSCPRIQSGRKIIEDTEVWAVEMGAQATARGLLCGKV